LFLLTWGAEVIGGQHPDWNEASACLVLGVLLLAALGWHLKRAAHPLIDLSSFAIPTFTITIVGGSLFRMAIGAVPFLLPLMFQLGFGLDAFHSGLLVIAVFAGNLMMKPATTPILRRFGFKTVILVNGMANVSALAACSLLTPATPVWLIAAILFIGGLTRSMQFSALNTIAFADVPQPRMAAANTLFSTAFQVALGLGVALGATGVRLGHWSAQQLGIAGWPAIDYRLAFLLVALVSLLGLMMHCACSITPEQGYNVSMEKLKDFSQIVDQAARGELVFPTSVNAALRLQLALADPDCETDDVIRKVLAEPLLAARTVALANAAVFNRSGVPVTSVRAAVQRVGFRNLYTLAASMVVRQFGARIRDDRLRRQADQLWRHTAHTAALAYVIARKLTATDADTALFAGIVHEAGGLYLLARADEIPACWTIRPSGWARRRKSFRAN
jgi:MFS family permease